MKPQVFPFGCELQPDAFNRNPYPTLALLRTQEPISWIPAFQMYYLTRHADVQRVLLDSRYNGQYGGAMWFDRVQLNVRSEIDPGNDANVWKGRARFTAGFNDWRFAAVGGVSGGTQLISG